MSLDDLIAAAAEKMGMPAAMVRRSAEARAKAEGLGLEAVLADWAGVDAPESSSEDEAPEETAEAAPTAKSEPAPKPAATGIDKFVEMAAEAMKMPASMIRRSAAARADVEERSYEEVLADWAGVDVSEVQAAADEKAAPVEDPAEAPAEGTTEDTPSPAAAEGARSEDQMESEPEAETEPEPEADVPATVEVIGEATEPETPAAEEDEPELVGAGSGVPRWLSTLFVVGPALAIIYAAFLPNGPNCGDAGQLAIDPVTGIAVECDGSAYGEVVVDYLAMGAQLYEAWGCAGCHGAGGGGGSGPAFTGGTLLATFPEGQCAQHTEWIRLGTTGWPDTTYGATNKQVGGFGVMPGFGTNLTDTELAAVAIYERVQFGGETLNAALDDCGLTDDGEDADEVQDTDEVTAEAP
ncbi:MAG TPA: c-type cytochrome [Acidimicrobiia bacterium]|nr:c-type cytochrome [Acidimicrobiia bacterium]